MATGAIRYNSWWDVSTWCIIAFVVLCCFVPCFFDGGTLIAGIIGFAMLVFLIVALRSIYYKIDGNQLIVYTFFVPTSYPVDKIKEIKPTKSILSAPATSLSHRLAITFTDRKVLKSSMPVIISPANQEDFINQLLQINPSIICR